MDISATVSYSKDLPEHPGTPDLTVPPTFTNRPEAQQVLSSILRVLAAATDGKIQYTGGLPYQPPEAP